MTVSFSLEHCIPLATPGCEIHVPSGAVDPAPSLLAWSMKPLMLPLKMLTEKKEKERLTLQNGTL